MTDFCLMSLEDSPCPLLPTIAKPPYWCAIFSLDTSSTQPKNFISEMKKNHIINGLYISTIP